ncbi:amidohydrolase family protein [Halorientalis halophila]|uniref:amidohydrolase family protein n=1 Tax=Halorientalis halophila TaxID=3108499 RepID=UPI00300B943C
MSDRSVLEGTILRGKAFEAIEGRVILSDGQIVGVEEEPVESDDVVVPAFVNAHTHIGDSIAKEAGEGLDLDELVAPPDGLKHRLLREASHEETVAAMERSLGYMRQGGTAACIEFREGGVDGVRAMAEAAEGLDVDVVTLGREEIAAMEAGDGFGASGARDGEFGRERTATRKAGKLFGIHAGERDPDDINGALDLDPDFLVHMVHPEPIHLDRVEDRNVPIVVCPRSNLVTGVGTPDIAELASRTTVALGTDNVMLNSPSMFREMEFAAKLSDVPAREILAMATHHGAEIADLNCGVIEEDRDARLFVLDGDSDNLTGYQNAVRAVVRRAGVADVREVVLQTAE